MSARKLAAPTRPPGLLASPETASYPTPSPDETQKVVDRRHQQLPPPQQFFTLTVSYKLTRHIRLDTPSPQGQTHVIAEATVKEVAGEGASPGAAYEHALTQGLRDFVAGTFDSRE